MKWRELWDEWIYQNGSYKLVAIFITLILWISVLARKETTLIKEIPLSFITKPDQFITSTSAHEVKLQLSGSRRTLKRFAAEHDVPITVDLSNTSIGRLIVAVPEESVKLPFGVKVAAVDPPSLVIDIDTLTKKKVPVIINWHDIKEKNRVILHARVEPSEITIEGGRQAVEKVREILTSEVSSRDAITEQGLHRIKAHIRGPEIEGLKPIADQDVTITY